MEWTDIVVSSKKEPKLSENALIVLEKRYLAKDATGRIIETPAGLFKRVAAFVASAEFHYGASAESVAESANEFYEMMADLLFLPNSPTLMNAGRPLGQLSACFVLPVEDSMEGIFDAVKHMALIHKSGGGTGFSFSRLRPKDDFVRSTAGVSSGPVSFMNIFNAATETIKQGGTRRGANMAILAVDHPDIVEFITAKEDPTALTNFNLSVAITDAFMDALERDAEYPLVNPNTKRIVRQAKAREIFQLIVRKAWESGEPGVIFIDRINEANVLKSIGLIESTNPCVTGDTTVLTVEGPRMARDLVGTRFTAVVDGAEYASSPEGFFSTGIRRVFRLRTREGYEVRLTADHPVLRVASVSRGAVKPEWVKAAELSAGDKIRIHNHRGFRGWEGRYGFKEGYLTGLSYDSGLLKKHSAISAWQRKAAVNSGIPCDMVTAQAMACVMDVPCESDFRGFADVRARGEYRISHAKIETLCAEAGIGRDHALSAEFESCSSDFCRGFLRGLFDRYGSVEGVDEEGAQVRLSHSSIRTLQCVQRILLRLGIASVIYQDRGSESERMLPSGKGCMEARHTMSWHELVISHDNLPVFADRVGFGDDEKSAMLNQVLSSCRGSLKRERFVVEVLEIVPDGIEEVFDVRVPGVNMFDGAGFVLHNCGEQPLLPYESCNLGSINIGRVVKKDKGGYELDENLLRALTRRAVRFLDNIIDLNKYPLPEIERNTKANRKIGLGIMGFADYLIRRGIPYDSEQAVSEAERVMAVLQDESKRASADLADERGAFPNFERSDYAARGERPLRNATTTTIAPTGTISIIAGASSGIEPIYAIAYVRNVMDNHTLVEVNPLFEEIARDRGLYSEDLMALVASRGSVSRIEEIPEDIRRIFVSAHDVAPEWHIRIQAAFQRHVDNAVSKTINFRSDATIDDVEKSYLLAYRLGCKGITVYRDQSRSSQVLAARMPKKTERKDEGARTTAIAPRPRGEITWGATRKMTTGCGSLYVTINEDEHGLFEVFATMGKGGGCAASQTEAVSRLISLALRSGIDLEQIIKQLKGVRCPNQAWEKGGRIYSCADAIAKALERHTGATPPASRENLRETAKHLAETNGKSREIVMVGVCPDCYGPLEFESGCAVCRACGFSRCG